MEYNPFEAKKFGNKEAEMIRITDSMSFASRMDVKSFKKAMIQQGELIKGVKEDLLRLIKVYEK